jgi:hypothetical protein
VFRRRYVLHGEVWGPAVKWNEDRIVAVMYGLAVVAAIAWVIEMYFELYG